MKLRVMFAAVLMGGTMQVHAQASAIPSAQVSAEAQPASGEQSKGRGLMTEMVNALGGDAWLNRKNWEFQGRAATFYKGMPHEDAPQFEEYYRANPFAELVIVITHSGIFIATNHKDIAEIWTPDNGYELTFRGKKPLPEKDVQDYMRRRAHSLETVVHDWLSNPDTIVTYEGSNMVSRRLAEQVSVITAKNDAVTIELEESTHRPLSISFQWRDPLYKDLNTDEIQYDDYHVVQGIATPYAVTYLHNGDTTQQRFFTKIAYNQPLGEDLFDPDAPLNVKTKGK
jgi:hypothetical protein